MEEMSKGKSLKRAAMLADMDRKTAHKYVEAGMLPSQLQQPRKWRTRPDPFAEDWPQIEAWLIAMPALDSKSVFELLEQASPGRYTAAQMRTLQRRIKQWRAAAGPARNVVFGQAHR